MKITKLTLILLTVCCLIGSSGCTTTRTENGVTIEGPRNQIPFVPFL